MSYKNQIYKEIVNGKYSKKSYTDLVKRKSAEAQVAEPADKADGNDIFTEQSDAEKNPTIELVKRIVELEDYLVELTIEIDNLKATQKNIINALNKISLELNSTKNKITR